CALPIFFRDQNRAILSLYPSPSALENPVSPNGKSVRTGLREQLVVVRHFAGRLANGLRDVGPGRKLWFAKPGSIETNPYRRDGMQDRKSTRLNSSHLGISYAVFCLKKKKKKKKKKRYIEL